MSKHRAQTAILRRIAQEATAEASAYRLASIEAAATVYRIADELGRRNRKLGQMRQAFRAALLELIPGADDPTNREAQGAVAELLASLRRQGVELRGITTRWPDAPAMPFDEGPAIPAPPSAQTVLERTQEVLRQLDQGAGTRDDIPPGKHTGT